MEQNKPEKEQAGKEEKYIRRERYSGEMKRSFYVGDYLKQEDIRAAFKHGILTLNIPKRESPKVTSNKFITIEG
jgi:HSP20 family molecular chaperone IbpA